MARNNTADNFDPDGTIKQTLDKIDRPDKFAEVFCHAAKKQIDIKECISDIVRETVAKDAAMKEFFQELFQDVINADKTYVIMKLWRNFKGFCLLIGGMALTVLIQFAMKQVGLS